MKQQEGVKDKFGFGTFSLLSKQKKRKQYNKGSLNAPRGCFSLPGVCLDRRLVAFWLAHALTDLELITEANAIKLILCA